MTTLKDEAIRLLDQWEAIARDKNRYIAALEARIDELNDKLEKYEPSPPVVNLAADAPCINHEWIALLNSTQLRCLHFGKIA
jgi:hypothetical protein